ncbi:MAG: AraC family transcriptional regulator [Actinomycetota bacterium]|nr:AraC family transcriptional regulator [Actinomycetota bacterium]
MLDHDTCYRAVSSRDGRFDGWFYTAVTSTGIYCRPSCPAMTPKRRNVRFYPSAAAAQGAGFRACRRCRPDASPGSPEWNVRADVVGRAMRLIADGLVDREGVTGLAARLGYSERQLHRLLVHEVGAGAQALARAQRAHTARVLVETTELPLAEIAFAAGFASIRQFNDTVRLVFATTPSTLRAAAVARGGMGTPGTLTLRLPVRPPFDGRGLLRLLATKSVPGVEHVDETSYHRALDLPHGEGVVTLTPREDHVGCVLRVNDPRDVVPAVARCRRLLDLDADAAAIDEQLGADPLLKPLVTAWPGVRVVGAVDGGAEMAIRAVIGQQVSVAGARTVAARLASVHGKPLTSPDAHITRHFPSAEALAEADPESLPMPRSRGRALVTVCAAIAEGRIDLDAGADREEATRALLALPGIGPWTADYVRLRALGDPDVMLASDLGVRRALERRGQPGDPRSVAARAQAWRPWRSYALMHLWHVITDREIS